MASLLEVGTGFHPELTGRENIYLNGAILGMTRAEIRRKFDEIVAFAEVEKFLDTPVKRYSSGMYVRLAFAVAAHLEPEILIVDEVLAVGDAEFQKKCLGKMNDVAANGRTVLLVSHDMRSITLLCKRAILLNSGSVQCDSTALSVATIYLHRKLTSQGVADLRQRADHSGTGSAQFEYAALIKDGAPSFMFDVIDSCRISIGVRVLRAEEYLLIKVTIVTEEALPVFQFCNDYNSRLWGFQPGLHRFTIDVERLALYPGKYTVSLYMCDRSGNRVDYVLGAMTFDVVQTSDSGIPRPLDRSNGLVLAEAIWTHELAVGEEKSALDYATHKCISVESVGKHTQQTAGLLLRADPERNESG